MGYCTLVCVLWFTAVTSAASVCVGLLCMFGLRFRYLFLALWLFSFKLVAWAGVCLLDFFWG